jgi:hypothetical protein
VQAMADRSMSLAERAMTDDAKLLLSQCERAGGRSSSPPDRWLVGCA